MSYVPPLEHQKYIPSQIHVLGATTKGKTVILKEKGGIPWEIKAGKKTKTKRKNKKPSNRKKRTRRNSLGAFFEESGGLRKSEAHHFPRHSHPC